MNLTAYFTNNGSPATSKSPVITVWELDGTVSVSAASMTEVAGGFYYYDFTGYSNTTEYVFQAYESSLPTAEQYVVATNEVDSLSDQGVIKQILGLVQGNFALTGQTYDSAGRLLTATMNTYNNAAALTADTVLHTYSISATYDASGNLTNYTVTEG